MNWIFASRRRLQLKLDLLDMVIGIFGGIDRQFLPVQVEIGIELVIPE